MIRFLFCVKVGRPRTSCLFFHKTGSKLKEKGQSWFCCYIISPYGIKEKKIIYSLAFFSHYYNYVLWHGTLPLFDIVIFLCFSLTTYFSSLLPLRFEIRQTNYTWCCDFFAFLILSFIFPHYYHYVYWHGTLPLFDVTKCRLCLRRLLRGFFLSTVKCRFKVEQKQELFANFFL